jgi:hypothetical protein
MGPRDWFQGMNSASLCSVVVRYENPIPNRCLAPIDFLKIPAQEVIQWIDSASLCSLACRTVKYGCCIGPPGQGIDSLGSLKCLQIRALEHRIVRERVGRRAEPVCASLRYSSRIIFTFYVSGPVYINHRERFQLHSKQKYAAGFPPRLWVG